MGIELTVAIDFVFLLGVVISFIWIFSTISGYGGLVGKSFKIIGWGAILTGISHIVEAASLYFPDHHNDYLIILSHHFLAVTGLVLMAYGFKILIKK